MLHKISRIYMKMHSSTEGLKVESTIAIKLYSVRSVAGDNSTHRSGDHHLINMKHNFHSTHTSYILHKPTACFTFFSASPPPSSGGLLFPSPFFSLPPAGPCVSLAVLSPAAPPVLFWLFPGSRGHNNPLGNSLQLSYPLQKSLGNNKSL